nr:copper chaperone PCu(A)C [uncultured Sphingosinicella sp.]
MRVLLATAFLTLGLSGCGGSGSEPHVTIENARVTLPAVRGRPGAGYFTAEASALPEAIVAVTAPPPTRIEMHESMAAGSMTSMRPIPSAPFEADRPIAFEPGGKHLMMFDIDPAVKPGDTLPLTFRFAKAPPVTVQAEVLGPGGAHAEH